MPIGKPKAKNRHRKRRKQLTAPQGLAHAAEPASGEDAPQVLQQGRGLQRQALSVELLLFSALWARQRPGLPNEEQLYQAGRLILPRFGRLFSSAFPRKAVVTEENFPELLSAVDEAVSPSNAGAAVSGAAALS